MESFMPTPIIKFKDFIPLITLSDFGPLSICDVASSNNHLDSSLHNNVEGCPMFVICLNDSRGAKLVLLIIYLSSSIGTKSMLSNLGLNVCPIKSSSIESLGGPIVNHLPTPQKATNKKHSYDFSQIFEVLCASKLSWNKLQVGVR
jgi:hypothetical protein